MGCHYDCPMFSYRHAFHAGNHADALKHLTLIATLRHLMAKPAPLLLADTHAGAGLYRLDSEAARTSGEAAQGVLALQAQANGQADGGAPAPEALRDYLDMVASFNAPGKSWRIYPGSPFIMQRLMAAQERAAVHDRLRLFELHPSDIHALQANVAQLQAGRQITIQTEDGFAALPALLPPPAAAGSSRRALALMDPSYEIKTDYARAAAAIQQCLQRFATGVYLVWHPIIARPEAHGLPRRLKTLANQARRGWLHATLNVGAAKGQAGLSASGVFVINPPHTLPAALRAALPAVLNALKRGAGQGWTVETGGLK